jgi:hypothetical protein
VDVTDGFSVAYLRELVVLTQCFQFPLADAIGRLRKMHVKPPKSSDGEASPFGFTS